MAQRISRAKQSIKNSGIPFQLPTAEERRQRLRAVLHVLYLIFNEGYTSSAGPDLRRGDLSHEAMRLTRIVHSLQPDDTEVAGLLALMLLTDARRLARTTAGGELIPLAQQDRSLWDKQQIAEGIALISATLPKGSVGPYQLQAAIAAVHDEAARAEDTDWPQILALYDLLQAHVRQPDGHVKSRDRGGDGARRGEGLGTAGSPLKADARIADHHRLDAVRAHLLELAGDRKGAISITVRPQAKQEASRSATTFSPRPRDSRSTATDERIGMKRHVRNRSFIRDVSLVGLDSHES